MTNKDYSHIKQGMYVLKEEITDEETWKGVRDAFIQAGARDWLVIFDYEGFIGDTDIYYGWDEDGDLYIPAEPFGEGGFGTEAELVSVDFILNGPKKEEEEDAIKVGDYVEVINTGYSYTTYQRMAEVMGLDNYLAKDGRFPKSDRAYKVIALEKHPDSSTTTLLGIEAQDGEHHIISLEGVKKVYKLEEEDNTMFKVGEVYQCGESQVKVVYITEDKDQVVGIGVDPDGSEMDYVGLWDSSTGDWDCDNYGDLSYKLKPIKDNTETLKEIEELKERIKQLEESL